MSSMHMLKRYPGRNLGGHRKSKAIWQRVQRYRHQGQLHFLSFLPFGLRMRRTIARCDMKFRCTFKHRAGFS